LYFEVNNGSGVFGSGAGKFVVAVLVTVGASFLLDEYRGLVDEDEMVDVRPLEKGLSPNFIGNQTFGHSLVNEGTGASKHPYGLF